MAANRQSPWQSVTSAVPGATICRVACFTAPRGDKRIHNPPYGAKQTDIRTDRAYRARNGICVSSVSALGSWRCSHATPLCHCLRRMAVGAMGRTNSLNPLYKDFAPKADGTSRLPASGTDAIVRFRTRIYLPLPRLRAAAFRVAFAADG